MTNWNGLDSCFHTFFMDKSWAYLCILLQCAEFQAPMAMICTCPCM